MQIKGKLTRGIVASAVTAGLVLVGISGTASGYQPDADALYVAEDPASCNKSPCILYPKSAQLPSGRLVAAFEDSQGPVVGQDMPIYKSDDFGDTWQKLSDLKAPAYLTDDPAYSSYTSNWTNPYLYVLPEPLGSMPAGTLLLSNVVSGGRDTAGGRDRLAIVMYASLDQGATWEVISTVITSPNVTQRSEWEDPVWEPFLMMRDGKLVVFYSDENDYVGYDPSTGVPIPDPDNVSGADSFGQILAHKTWDGSGTWSDAVVDVAGFTETSDGKSKIGGGRPGMTTVASTTDGKWILTFEYWGGGENVRFKIADDPLEFFTVGGEAGANISQLPVAAGSGPLATGGSSVLINRPDGSIVYNAAGSGSVWVNESGRSDGVWKQYQTTVAPGYSRNLQYVHGTGRIEIIQAPWGSGPVTHAALDLGHSEGAYYSLVNRQTGQVLSTAADKTQDANLTGDQPDIITWSNNPANDTQRWHVQPKGSNVTFLNKAGGRALGIWFGNASQNQPIAQWVDDNGSDKLWSLTPTADGFVKIQSSKNTALYITGSGSGGQVRLGAALDASTNAAADDAQEWQLVQEAPTSATLTPQRALTSLVSTTTVAAGSSLQLNAAVANPADAKTHADVNGRVYAIAGSADAVDLGIVSFDAQEQGTVTIPASFTPSGDVKLVVQFDASAAVWDSVGVTAPAPALHVTAVASTRCVAGKVVLTVQVTNGSEVAVNVSTSTAYGSKSSAALQPSKSASSAFSTRLAAVGAGQAHVVATPVSGGDDGSVTVDAGFPARSCG